MTTDPRVRAALAAAPKLRQRAALLDLLTRIEHGCRSQLELWGYDHVFTGPEFTGLRWQVPVRLGRRTIWLDAYDEESATNFELDGAKYHTGPRDRERDLRRDAELAELGIHPCGSRTIGMTNEAHAVRRQALAIMEVRRAEGRRSLVA